MKKILLLGYMGSGKSLIGKMLAEQLQITFYDLDNFIEKHLEMPISEIFKQKGEIYFRNIEHQIFKELMSRNETFSLSLGGGTPYYANNHLLLNGENVTSIYLNASIENLYNRLILEIKNRPLIANLNKDDGKEFIAKHLFDRSYFYNQATLKIQVNDKSPKQITDEIISLLA